jgi:CRISPR-associated endonuclease/helicase Cas3
LEEIRERLGYPNMRDARQVPLMLLALDEVWEEIFEDDNLGLNVEPAGKVEPTYFRHPNIRRYEATLEKKTPSTKLKLQWEEPKEEEE